MRPDRDLHSQANSQSGDFDGIVDNIGFPTSGINLTLSNSGVIGTSDGEILIALKPEHRIKPVDYIRDLRRTLPQRVPGDGILFSACGHCQPGAQLRIARAH